MLACTRIRRAGDGEGMGMGMRGGGAGGVLGGREGDVRGGRTSSRQLSNAARSKFLQGTSASFFFHHARAKNRNGVGS